MTGVQTCALPICSSRWFVRNHNDILSMSCHESSCLNSIGVATKMLKTCSFLCFVCTHYDYIVEMFPSVFLPMSPFIATRILTNYPFQCFVCNLSNFLGDFVFSQFGDVPMIGLHIDHAYELYYLYLCCANGVMNKNGHVMNDMVLYHAHTFFAWSLLCRYYLWMRWHEWLQLHIALTEDLASRPHRHLTKVPSLYLDTHAMSFKNWLLFECCFVFLVLNVKGCKRNNQAR